MSHKESEELRRIFIVRHGERIDFTFGSFWISSCFDKNGKYVPHDKGMPSRLPDRFGSPKSFSKDSPLTLNGEKQAKTVGERLKSAGIDNIKHVFCSPALRSLQTCQKIIEGLDFQSQLEIGLEPGLFEWLGWPQPSPFLTKEEIRKMGIKLKEDHEAFVSFSQLESTRNETFKEFYERSFIVVKEALESTKHIGGDILLVGHGLTLDACSRQLIGESPRNDEAKGMPRHIPYCSLAVVQEETSLNDSSHDTFWKLAKPPIQQVNDFDWNILITY